MCAEVQHLFSAVIYIPACLTNILWFFCNLFFANNEEVLVKPMAACRRVQTNSSILITLHKTQVQWNKELYIKTSYIKAIEEKVGGNLELISRKKKDFLNRRQLAQALRTTIAKCEFMKLSSYCKAKANIQTK